MSEDSAVQIAKDFLNNHEQYKHLADGDVTVESHHPSYDAKLLPHIPGVNDSDLGDEGVDIVSFRKDIEVMPNVVIPKIVRVTVKNGVVDKTVESK